MTSHGRAKFQVGLRGIVVADRFEVYVSYRQPFRRGAMVRDRRHSPADPRIVPLIGEAASWLHGMALAGVRLGDAMTAIRKCDWRSSGAQHLCCLHVARGYAPSLQEQTMNRDLEDRSTQPLRASVT
jgi:hypothetical protein